MGSALFIYQFSMAYLHPHPHLHPYASVKLNLTSPPGLAPPTHVELKLPVGHVNCAALTHLSHLPLLISIVAPACAASSVNFDVPDVPVVDAGAPPHFVIAPAMPPQIPRMATLVEWVSNLLVGGGG